MGKRGRFGFARSRYMMTQRNFRLCRIFFSLCVYLALSCAYNTVVASAFSLIETLE